MLIIKFKFGISSTNINADAHRANKNSSNFENNNNKHIWYTKINSTNNIVTHWTMNNTQKFVWASSNKNSVIEYENNKKIMNEIEILKNKKIPGHYRTPCKYK